MSTQPPRPARPLRLAAIATTWRHGHNASSISHAEVILKRWLEPGPADHTWGWTGPRTTLANLYIEQTHDDDEIHHLAPRHNLHLAPTLDDALTRGKDQLDVDAVLLIGEHGEYPRNELGQKLYPRRELFDRIVAVYERCGQVAPLFCDKHFSWNFDWAREMLHTADRMGFMLFGGSSLPHCQLDPSLPTLENHPPRHVVAVYAGDIEAYGFHSMEMAQTYLETRPGGETGIRAVTAYEGPALAEAQQRGEWPATLFNAAVRAADSAPEDVTPRMAFVVDYADGLRVTHINLQRGLKGWALAVQRENDDQTHAARVVMGGRDDFHSHFAGFARVIENTLLAGQPTYPTQRTLLATGTIAAAMRARSQPATALTTPELNIHYTPAPPLATGGTA